MKHCKVPGWLSGSLIAATFGLLWLLERRRPLRRETESKLTRTGRNLAVAGIAAFSLQVVERPLIQPLTEFVEERRWGLLKLIKLPTIIGSRACCDPVGLHPVLVACAHAPASVSLAISSTASRRSGPRCFHCISISRRRAGYCNGLARRSGSINRDLAIITFRVANVSSSLNSFSSFERSPHA